MANYYGCTRTNYFSVTDKNKFLSIVKNIYSDDEIEVITKEINGIVKYGFICGSPIEGFALSENGEYMQLADACGADISDFDYDGMLEALQKVVAPDDAIIITEVGHEKLRYLIGSAVIVTQKEIRYRDINDIACDEARRMLNNSKWVNDNSY